MINRQNVLSCIKTNSLTLATMLGVIGGIILGLGLRIRETPWSEREAMYVAYLGELFLRLLKVLILPLIIPSLISAVGSLDLSLSTKVGCWSVVYYMSTTFLAVVLGIVLVVSIHPGVEGQDKGKKKVPMRNVTTPDIMLDLIRQMCPPNIVQATVQQSHTKLIYPEENSDGSNGTKYRNQSDPSTWEMKEEYSNGSNILGLVVFAITLGIALAKIGEKGKPLLNFFISLTDAMMVITTWVIYLAPGGIFFLVAGEMIKMDDLSTMLISLGWYIITVLLGLFLHGLIVLPTIYFLFSRKLPCQYIWNMSKAITTAFGTASSSATLPVTIQCLEELNHVDPRVSRFVLPIGATINMDGTALYEAVAAIFISQVNGMHLGIGQIIAISITATAASVGAAGIPQAGLITMVMVLETVGLPPEDVSIILSIDWLLDRFRTAINVLGDSIGAGIVFHLSKDQLSRDELDELGDTDQEIDAVPMMDLNGSRKIFDKE